MSKVLLKISGGALKNGKDFVAEKNLVIIVKTIKWLLNHHHEVAIIIGGGNFFRGREHQNMKEINRDSIGMLATCMNAFFLRDYFDKNDISSIISTPFTFPNLLPFYSDEKLNNYFHSQKVIIFGGGVGKTGVSTDSAIIVACEKLEIDLIIKMTDVDGVYDSDPKINKDAKMINNISFKELFTKKFKILDPEAIDYIHKKNIKMLIVNFNKWQEITKYFNNEQFIGTKVGFKK